MCVLCALSLVNIYISSVKLLGLHQGHVLACLLHFILWCLQSQQLELGLMLSCDMLSMLKMTASEAMLTLQPIVGVGP